MNTLSIVAYVVNICELNKEVTPKEALAQWVSEHKGEQLSAANHSSIISKATRWMRDEATQVAR